MLNSIRLTKTETNAQALLKHCSTKTETNAQAINKKKRNKRVREVSFASRFTHPKVNLTSKSFSGSLFVEKSGLVSNGSA